MVRLTPEQQQAIEQAGTEPVRLEDPETNNAYYFLKAEVFERVRDIIQPKLDIPRQLEISTSDFHGQDEGSYI